MKLMGLETLYRTPRTSKANPEHKIYPYLLKGLDIDHPNQVWASDLTYIPMARGFFYLVAVMDWHSRYIISWRLSNTMEADFCVEALKDGLSRATPEIFNTDQGSQFTSEDFVGAIKAAGAQVSMDGRGRYLDNVFVERLWRSLKYEEVYLNPYENTSRRESQSRDGSISTTMPAAPGAGLQNPSRSLFQLVGGRSLSTKVPAYSGIHVLCLTRCAARYAEQRRATQSMLMHGY